MPVFDTGAPRHVPVGPDCLGRLLNVFGTPLDGGGPLATEAYRNILAAPAPLHETVAGGDILQHLESALRRVNRTRRELTLRGNALRQEEITEEIEIILLSIGMSE